MTIGEHLRNRRLELGLLQREVAEEIGVTEECIMLWEKNHIVPTISYLPSIIRFLGYNPMEVDTSTLGGQIRQYRILNGLSHKKTGALLGVNASTINAWERGKHQPYGERLRKLKRLLQAV